ncbi:hypothetical protein SEVIR_7G333600v4 [Setaria viridis]|uniref:Auxin efflux carrier component n=2 Tax=Setaria viridis TaxID=4556 RepID=A0A4U6U0Z2_SETVI|nr:probable auxin efflux carrier component 5a [Setaria viridis]TKW07835.1 hypothetical protein SEVIR_7G333600v2 [Setaria viridis]
MISWGDVYKVASALVPLYVPLLLGFFSVRRWKIFSPEQCESVNSLVAFFAIPFFTFGFTVHTDPFRANYRAIAADVISKAVIAAVIGGWVLLTGGRKNAVSWSITGFSLSTLTSSLVVGVPMAQAMYGDWAQQLVVQLSVFQAIVWITLLLFALEVRKAALGTTTQIRRAADVPVSDIEASTYADDHVSTTSVLSPPPPPPKVINGVQASTEEIIAVVAAGEVRKDAIGGTQMIPGDGPDSSAAPAQETPHHINDDDVEASIDDDDAAYNVDDTSTFPQSALVIDDVEASNAEAIGVAPTVGGGRPSIWKLVKVVLYKLGRNPNTYASVGGIIWACIANRLQISLPIIIKNSIGIMAQCGNGLAMFSMGLFMAQQDKLIPCGPSLTFLSLVLKFVLDPIAMTIGSIAVGLRGDVVRVAIIQAAVPQSITSFIFAKEYGLHPDVLSTAVIVGMLVSVPLIVLFYVGLEGL